jgi:FkbM family methyltransferase
MYSQNQEDTFILNHWSTKYANLKGTLIDIGANDGKTLSNSLLLIQQGWSAHLFEPSKPTFTKMQDLHKGNDCVRCYNCGLSDETGTKLFYESGTLFDEGDIDLVSTTQVSEFNKWNGRVSFSESVAFFYTWQDWLDYSKLEDNKFDFISIDAEGEDWKILSQIDLTKHDCKILCVEWNSLPENDRLFTQYANSHNLFEINRNAENIIFAK